MLCPLSTTNIVAECRFYGFREFVCLQLMDNFFPPLVCVYVRVTPTQDVFQIVMKEIEVYNQSDPCWCNIYLCELLISFLIERSQSCWLIDIHNGLMTNFLSLSLPFRLLLRFLNDCYVHLGLFGFHWFCGHCSGTLGSFIVHSLLFCVLLYIYADSLCYHWFFVVVISIFLVYHITYKSKQIIATIASQIIL